MANKDTGEVLVEILDWLDSRGAATNLAPLYKIIRQGLTSDEDKARCKPHPEGCKHHPCPYCRDLQKKKKG